MSNQATWATVEGVAQTGPTAKIGLNQILGGGRKSWERLVSLRQVSLELPRNTVARDTPRAQCPLAQGQLLVAWHPTLRYTGGKMAPGQTNHADDT